MDYIAAEMPKSAYEYTVGHAVTFNETETQKLKQEAFAMMDQLHGWCTHKKASIMIDLVLALQPKIVVEVGIYGGKSFIPMAYALKKMGSGMAYGIDPWKSDVSAVGMEDVNYEWWLKLDHEMIMRDFLQKVRQFRLQRYVTVLRQTSTETTPMDSIDLIHIDGNHSEDSAYYDVTKWVPHVRSGGIIIFDDVDWPTTAKAVKWLDENCEPIQLVEDSNIWGIWRKR
jgi:predicted O-methyltransferase YrrM